MRLKGSITRAAFVDQAANKENRSRSTRWRDEERAECARLLSMCGVPWSILYSKACRLIERNHEKGLPSLTKLYLLRRQSHRASTRSSSQIDESQHISGCLMDGLANQRGSSGEASDGEALAKGNVGSRISNELQRPVPNLKLGGRGNRGRPAVVCVRVPTRSLRKFYRTIRQRINEEVP